MRLDSCMWKQCDVVPSHITDFKIEQKTKVAVSCFLNFFTGSFWPLEYFLCPVGVGHMYVQAFISFIIALTYVCPTWTNDEGQKDEGWRGFWWQIGRWADRQTDVCECRVAFVTKNVLSHIVEI